LLKLSSRLLYCFGEGLTAYEYTFIVQASDIPAVIEALDVGDVLSALKKRFRTRADNVKSFRDEHGIPYDFHNHVGE